MHHNRSEGAHGVHLGGSRPARILSATYTRGGADLSPRCRTDIGFARFDLGRGSSAEIFTGLEASNNATIGYLGAGYAFGKGLYEPGWRLRAVGSRRYDYCGTLFGAGADLATTFDRNASYAAALLGYQFCAETLIVKPFAGVEAEDQRISPRDCRAF
jgi:Cellulose biosynthesis protein BcsS